MNQNEGANPNVTRRPPTYQENKLDYIRRNMIKYKDSKDLDGKMKEELRPILGEPLYKQVPRFMTLTDPGNKLAAKITGMLIDFDVFEVEEIFKMIDDESVLAERVQEAEELIRTNSDPNQN